MHGLPRYAWFIGRRTGYHRGPEPTWRTASFGAKVAALAVLAMCGSLAAFLSIPAAAIVTALLHG